MEPSASEDIERIWAAISLVQDPCHQLSDHPLSIVDLGLINEVGRRGDVVEVRLTLTEPTCVFAHRIVGDLEDLAPGLPGVSRVEVIIEPLPIWEPSRMSPSALAFFAQRRSAFGPAFHNIPIAVAAAAGDSHGKIP